ncbi:hypothetical protein FGO68_gene13411 [Halteria grandinella]|uniref:Uncharacterized protein n=1 Tax=Halteria grandinella TaxID=5974 RepID=A0A8J8T4C7_HALGN|nr:hypothetical protein FGO68_gene13411 [Halteria grandinella]
MKQINHTSSCSDQNAYFSEYPLTQRNFASRNRNPLPRHATQSSLSQRVALKLPIVTDLGQAQSHRAIIQQESNFHTRKNLQQSQSGDENYTCRGNVANPLRDMNSVKWFKRMRSSANQNYISSSVEQQKHHDLVQLFRKFSFNSQRQASSSNSSRESPGVRADAQVPPGQIKIDDVFKMFKLSGIEGLDKQQIMSLFEPESDPLSKNVKKPLESRSTVDFKRFRDVMMSENVNQKFRVMIKKLRKRIRIHKLYGESSFIPLNINTMLTYLCQRSNLNSIRSDLNNSSLSADTDPHISITEPQKSIDTKLHTDQLRASLLSRQQAQLSKVTKSLDCFVKLFSDPMNITVMPQVNDKDKQDERKMQRWNVKREKPQNDSIDIPISATGFELKMKEKIERDRQRKREIIDKYVQYFKKSAEININSERTDTSKGQSAGRDDQQKQTRNILLKLQRTNHGTTTSQQYPHCLTSHNKSYESQAYMHHPIYPKQLQASRLRLKTRISTDIKDQSGPNSDPAQQQSQSVKLKHVSFKLPCGDVAQTSSRQGSLLTKSYFNTQTKQATGAHISALIMQRKRESEGIEKNKDLEALNLSQDYPTKYLASKRIDYKLK